MMLRLRVVNTERRSNGSKDICRNMYPQLIKHTKFKSVTSVTEDAPVYKDRHIDANGYNKPKPGGMLIVEKIPSQTVISLALFLRRRVGRFSRYSLGFTRHHITISDPG